MDEPKVIIWKKWKVLVILLLFSWSGAGNTEEPNVIVAGNGIVFSEWPRDVSERLGRSAQFRCSLEGSGDYSIAWLRNGTLLEKETSQRLQIDHVLWTDEGSYQCAINIAQGTVLSAPGTLRVIRPPRFTLEPQDASVGVGGSVRLECSVSAVPPAFISWLHNDLPLNHIRNTRFRIVDSGILHIRDVSSSDEGSYLCMASNSAGNVTSRPATLSTTSPDVPQASTKGSLRVLALPRNRTVVLGTSVVLECLLDAHPPPKIKWKRLSTGHVNRDRMEIVGTNLKIRNVQIGDEGFYACVLSLEDEEPVTYKAYLSVSYLPGIKELPATQTKKRGETARFVCFSQAHPPPSIHWYKNGKRVVPHGRVKLFPAEGDPVDRVLSPHGGDQLFKRDLVISSVQPEDAGIYQCFVSNPVGTVSAAAELNCSDNVNISDDQAPRNLRVAVEPESRRLRLRWEAPPGIPASKLALYIIHFYKTDTDGKGENTHPATDACDESGVCEAFCCSSVELEPYKNYTFRVSGLLKGGIFTPLSNTVIVQIWDGVARGVAPLTVYGLSDGSVKLDWKMPDPRTVPGQLTEFRIEYRREGESGARTERVPYLIEDHTLEGLLPKETYYFRVIPKTRAGYPTNTGDARFPWTSEVMDGREDGPEPPAPLINVKALDSTSVLLSWAQEGDVAVEKFKITHQLQIDGGPTKELEVSGTQRSHRITGLAPGSLYELSIRGVAAGGRLGLDASKLVRTKKLPTTITIPPPLSVMCDSETPRILKVTWPHPPTDRDITRYRVRYVKSPPLQSINASLIKTTEVNKQELIINVDMKNGVYVVAVQAFDRFNYTGPFSKDFTCSIVSRVPGPPLNVEVETVNSSSVLVTWEAPKLQNDTAILTYSVQVTDSRQGSDWKETSVNGSQRSVVLTGLSSRKVYFVKVSGVSGAGQGKFSEVVPLPLLPSTTTPTTVVIVSYKEGMIAGGLIALVCILLCALILYCRIRQERLGQRDTLRFPCFGRRNERSGSPKKLNGHVPNGHVTHLAETQELQELLPTPRLDANPECDSKGGIHGVQPRCSRILGQAGPHPHTLVGAQNGYLRHSPEAPRSEDLVVGVGGGGEVSSDLSHSPAATASSLHSWNQDERGGQHTSAVSMPNLADSGIGFDERLEKGGGPGPGQCGVCGGKGKNGFRRGTACT